MGSLVFLLLLGLAGWWAFEKSRRKTHPVPPGLQKDIDLPHEQEFELYHNALSLCSMKSRVCLAELGIPYRSHPIHLIETGAYENISRRFLAVNPAGTVPVLVHGGHPIYESHEQIRYAAQHAPPGSRALTPADPASKAAMEAWIDRSSLTQDPMAEGEKSAGNAVPRLTLPLFAAMIEEIPTWSILEGLLFHWDRKRPVMFLTMKLRGLSRFHETGPFGRMLDRGHRLVNDHLDALEARLVESGGPWILGGDFSLADVSWLVILERIRQVDNEHLFLGAGLRPACTAYWQRLQARPSYREAILEQTHSTIVRGTERLRSAKAANPVLREALEGAAR